MGNVLYMQYLAMESARKAVRDLIEFAPNWAENTITILLSELPLYRRAIENTSRKPTSAMYACNSGEVDIGLSSSEVYYHVLEQHEKYNDPDTAGNQLRYLSREALEECSRDWSKAHRMLEELKKRYADAIGEELAPRHAIACPLNSAA